MDTKTIIIAGGQGGVGRAAAARLAADGYAVALLYRSGSDEEVRECVSSLSGVGHVARRCDITDAAAVSAAVRSLAEDRRIFGCVLAATEPIVRKSLLELEDVELRKALEVEVIGNFMLCRALAPLLRAAGEGIIVGVTSMFIEPNHRAGRMGAYVPAKFALRGLLRELAAELAPYGVRVNAVAPSMMRTKLSDDLPDRLFDFAQEKNPMKSLLTPEELAGVISFLCSDDARAITGVSLPVAYGEVETL